MVSICDDPSIPCGPIHILLHVGRQSASQVIFGNDSPSGKINDVMFGDNNTSFGPTTKRD